MIEALIGRFGKNWRRNKMTVEANGEGEKKTNTNGDDGIDEQKVADSLRKIKKNIEEERRRNNGDEETTLKSDNDDSNTE